jgi:hypothetical protein
MGAREEGHPLGRQLLAAVELLAKDCGIAVWLRTASEVSFEPPGSVAALYGADAGSTARRGALTEVIPSTAGRIRAWIDCISQPISAGPGAGACRSPGDHGLAVGSSLKCRRSVRKRGVHASSVHER